MPHEIDRILRAFAGRPWAIEPARAQELAHVLALRHAQGPRAEPFRDGPAPDAEDERRGRVAVMRMHGTIAPRASAVRDISASFVSVERFMAAFSEMANDRGVRAIVLDVDSPGGMIDLVPEAAALIRGARREGRPIYAVANTLAASAAYWIASQADRFFATPSATVGSIGVRAMHEDLSGRLEQLGVKVTHVHAGPRKVEGNPFGPLGKEGQAALQAEIDAAYSAFVADVAAARGVDASVVQADPESGKAHMGGGRAYHAGRALELGMVDEIATIDEVIRRAASASPKLERERLALL